MVGFAVAGEVEEFVLDVGSVAVEGGEIVREAGPEWFGQRGVVYLVGWVGTVQEAVGDFGLELLGGG